MVKQQLSKLVGFPNHHVNVDQNELVNER